ncbi:MAG: hypothetical protein ACKO6F_03660 [Cyanobium sp.]
MLHLVPGQSCLAHLEGTADLHGFAGQIPQQLGLLEALHPTHEPQHGRTWQLFTRVLAIRRMDP